MKVCSTWEDATCKVCIKQRAAHPGQAKVKRGPKTLQQMMAQQDANDAYEAELDTEMLACHELAG
jgi:hypothetical protein